MLDFGRFVLVEDATSPSSSLSCCVVLVLSLLLFLIPDSPPSSLLLFTNSAVEDTTSSSAVLVAVVLAVVFTDEVHPHPPHPHVPSSSGDPGAIRSGVMLSQSIHSGVRCPRSEILMLSLLQIRVKFQHKLTFIIWRNSVSR